MCWGYNRKYRKNFFVIIKFVILYFFKVVYMVVFKDLFGRLFSELKGMVEFVLILDIYIVDGKFRCLCVVNLEV